MNTKIFINRIIRFYNIESSFKTKFEGIENVSLRIYKNITYSFLNIIFKNFLLTLLGASLIHAVGGFSKYFEIPYINEIISYKCIDNICDGDCCENYHYIHLCAKSSINRGVDSIGRHYLLFFYKTTKGDIFYEFVYNNEKPQSINITFSGYNNNTFIGNSSVDYTDTYSSSYRPLMHRSYDYIKRLINGTAHEVYYTNTLEKAVENTEKPVSLFYEKEEYIKYLRYKHIKYYKQRFLDL